MFEPASVRIGPYVQMWHEDDESRLLAAFTDADFQVCAVKRFEFQTHLGVTPRVDAGTADEIQVRRYRADARVVADRLDLLGFDLKSSLDIWEANIAAHAERMALKGEVDEAHALRSINGTRWLASLSKMGSYGPIAFLSSDYSSYPLPGSPKWLMSLANFAFDPLREIRLVVAAFPETQVIVNVTGSDWAWAGESGGSHASTKLGDLRRDGSSFFPIVVLTEGRNDAEFLAAGLSILYPHVVDLMKFMDFDQKNEGGAGALARLVKSFAAAGIANRTVAMFDNDSAATDALRSLDQRRLPPTIKVLRYPDLPLAASYPTIGPPSLQNPDGGTFMANVNGLAGSIEMYLGGDVLSGEGGALMPVRWSSLISAVGSYQGEVADKAAVHRRFRKKVAIALNNPPVVAKQDWSGIRAVLREIMGAFVP